MAKIAKKINELTGNDEKERELKEQFSFLQKIAETKCQLFKSEIEKMFLSNEVKDLQVVGNRIVSYYSSQHVDITSKCDDAIFGAIDSIFKGKKGIKEGFKSIVKKSLESLIGNISMGETSKDMFFVYPENNAIVRVDVKFYKYQFSKNGFIKNSENIFCYTMTKSIIDHTKITIDELLYFLTEMAPTEADIKEFIKEMKEIWDMLSNKDPEQVESLYLKTVNV